MLTANLNEVAYLDAGDKNITDLTGVKSFTALNRLFCNNNQLTSSEVRNGKNTTPNYFRAKSNPNLSYIFKDDTFCSFENWKSLWSNATFANNASECDALRMVDKLFIFGVSYVETQQIACYITEGNKI